MIDLAPMERRPDRTVEVVEAPLALVTRNEGEGGSGSPPNDWMLSVESGVARPSR